MERRPLTLMERMAFQGIQARDRELGYLAEAVRSDHRVVLDQIAERLGLAPGGLGTTHQIDVSSWDVVETPALESGG